MTPRTTKTAPPPTYAAQVTAIRAAMFGAALAQLHPNRPRMSLEQLAALAEAHQARMARAAAELRDPPAVAAAKRAARLRHFEDLARSI